jgi:predicted transcriptional regulator
MSNPFDINHTTAFEISDYLIERMDKMASEYQNLKAQGASESTIQFLEYQIETATLAMKMLAIKNDDTINGTHDTYATVEHMAQYLRLRSSMLQQRAQKEHSERNYAAYRATALEVASCVGWAEELEDCLAQYKR